jgi:hypothetical protein
MQITNAASSGITLAGDAPISLEQLVQRIYQLANITPHISVFYFFM